MQERGLKSWALSYHYLTKLFVWKLAFMTFGVQSKTQSLCLVRTDIGEVAKMTQSLSPVFPECHINCASYTTAIIYILHLDYAAELAKLGAEEFEAQQTKHEQMKLQQKIAEKEAMKGGEGSLPTDKEALQAALKFAFSRQDTAPEEEPAWAEEEAVPEGEVFPAEEAGPDVEVMPEAEAMDPNIVIVPAESVEQVTTEGEMVTGLEVTEGVTVEPEMVTEVVEEVVEVDVVEGEVYTDVEGV